MPDAADTGVLLDPARLESARGRLGEFGRDGFWERLRPVIEVAADPNRALANFERWLVASGNPETRAATIDDSPPLALRLLSIFGTSQVISSELIRDPDAALLLFEEQDVSRAVDAEEIEREAHRLFASAISFTHKLDQLRFVQKRTLARIVWKDLSGDAPPEAVWESLSELADGLLRSTLSACAEEYAFDPRKLVVIAMGKHGSRELNYSSDIDLVFVLDDSIEDVDAAARYCERFVRAICGKMGRGDLYRIDLRLRPFGKSGPVAHTLTALSKYLEHYAEPWETQAFVRARPCAGGEELGSCFMDVANQQVYRGARSDWFFDSLVDTKRRTEQETKGSQEGPANVKLGPGGIRDIEFIVQTLQLVAGKDHSQLRGVSTMEALEHLKKAQLISERESASLSSAYRFLRQVEHRIQLAHSLHSHTLPESGRERDILARMMRFRDARDFMAELERRRNAVRRLLVDRFPLLGAEEPDYEKARESFAYKKGSREASALARLLSGLGEEPAIDSDMSGRIGLIVESAPRTISDIAFHGELWDIAFSEEIEFTQADDHALLTSWESELGDSKVRWEASVAAIARRASVVASLKQAFHRDAARSGLFQAAAADMMLRFLLDNCGGKEVDIIALGSYGAQELLLGSDWDVMLLANSDDIGVPSEKAGEEWMRAVRKVSIGSPFPVDVRLRPEGRSGLIVRTPASLAEYAKWTMESWERLAYSRARSVRGSQGSREALFDAVYGKGWTQADEAEASRMRKRVHTERVQTNESNRDLKLGPGSLFDIEWLVAFLKLRTDCSARRCVETGESLRRLADASAVTILERDALIQSHELFSLLRNAMYLLELDSDSVLPENPQKLDRIAHWLRIGSANELLRDVETCRREVLAAFQSILGETEA